MPSVDSIKSARVSQSKGEMIWWKSGKGIQGTDSERSGQLWQEDRADAQNSGIVVSEAKFNIGDPVLTKCGDGKLVIMKDSTREN